MKYAFILGGSILFQLRTFCRFTKNGPSLGLSGEPLKILAASPSFGYRNRKSIVRGKIAKKLGGVIKILEVVDIIKKREQDSINFALKHYFKPSVLKKQFLRNTKARCNLG